MKKILFVILLSSIIFSNGQSQTITTYAGDGYLLLTNFPVAGTYAGRFTGDGGPATNASFDLRREPNHSYAGIVFDNDGNLIISDTYNNRIRKISPLGIITTMAVAGGWLTAVTKDAYGNLFCLSHFKNVNKITALGSVSNYAGSSSEGYSGDVGPATSAEIAAFYGALATDDTGNVFIADQQNGVLRKVRSSTGIIYTYAGIYGSPGFSGDGGPSTAAQISSLGAIAIDGNGNLLMGDGGRLRKISPSGTISTIAGGGSATTAPYGDGGPATDAVLSCLSGIVVDRIGNIYIADADVIGIGHNVVRKIGTTGIITKIAGSGTTGFSGDGGNATAAKLNRLGGIALDDNGDLYIADVYNNRIRKVTFTTASPSIICSGSSSTLSATAAGSGGTYVWTPSTGLSATTGASVVATPTVTTVYTVTGTDIYGGTTVNRVKVSIASPVSVGSSSVCLGSSTTISASGGVSYSWAPSSGLSSTTNASVIASPTSTAVYTVTSIDAYGCTSTGISTVTVNSLPVVSGNSITICNGLSGTLTASGAINYTWSPGATLTATTGGSVTASPTVTTIYTISGTNSNGCVNTANVTVSVNNIPSVPGITGTLTVCVNSNVTLSNATSGGTWSSANTAVATANSSTGRIRGISAGDATISYSVTNSCGTGYAMAAVTVNPLPNAGTITGVSAICRNVPTTFTTSGMSGGTWSSTSSYATVSTSTGVVTGIISANRAAHVTNIIYSYTNTCGTATVTYSTTIKGLPDITISPTATGVICTGETKTVTGTPYTAGYSTGAWSTTSPSYATITSIDGHTSTISGISAGTSIATYIYTFTDDTHPSVCAGADTVRFSIVSKPVFTVTGSTELTPSGGCGYPASSVLTVVGTSGTFSWAPASSTIATLACSTCTSTSNTVSATSAGTEIYTVTKTLPYYYCVNLAYTTVTVNVYPCKEDNSTGIARELAPPELTIYPNPTSGQFTISLPPIASSAVITITDVSGCIVATRISAKQKEDFDLGNLSHGLYIIVVEAEDKKYRQKVLLE